MVLNVGIVSAFIIYKNRPGAMTRLQKLKKKLTEKPISYKILYSYPVKKIFSIIAILCFILGLILFLKEYKSQLIEKYNLSQHQYSNEIKAINSTQQSKGILSQFLQQTNQLLPLEIHNQYMNVENTVKMIILFFILPVIILVKQLNFQRLIVKRRKIGDSVQISGHIEKQQFSLFKGWQNKNTLLCQQSDILFIQLCGQQRFTNTTYYYALKKVAKNTQKKTDTQRSVSQQHLKTDQNGDKVNQELIITKGNIFQARKNIIYLCHVLNKQINLNIKNGSVKQTKPQKTKRKIPKRQ